MPGGFTGLCHYLARELSLDEEPIEVMAAELKAGEKGKFWEAHFLGKEKEYCHIERMANLDKIPKPFGFKVAAFPIKIEEASAGWVRAVAILED